MLSTAAYVQCICFLTFVGTLCSMLNVYIVQHAKYTEQLRISEETHMLCHSNNIHIDTELMKCNKAQQDVDSINPRLLALIDTLELSQIIGSRRCLVIAQALHDAWCTVVILFVTCLCLAAWLWLHVYKTNMAHRNLSDLPIDQSLRCIDRSSAPIGSIAYKQHWE